MHSPADNRCQCTDCPTLRRVIVLLCLLGLGLIAYGFLHNAFLSGASALAVGSSWGDFIA